MAEVDQEQREGRALGALHIEGQHRGRDRQEMILTFVKNLLEIRGGELAAALARFDGMRILVVGDLIVDRYTECDPVGMSQEDPTIVVTPIDEKRFVGGAGIVAAHARGLGAEVRFFTVMGEDEAATYAHAQLGGFGVAVEHVTDLTRPTTTKQRFRALGKTLLRVNRLTRELQAK